MGAKKIVFDFGMHAAQDTRRYLAEGYQVVAIEAFSLSKEQNTILNYIVSSP